MNFIARKVLIEISFHIRSGSVNFKQADDPLLANVTVCYIYRGTSPIRKRPPPHDPPTTPGKGLRLGPRGVGFLMSEVPLHLLPEISREGPSHPAASGEGTG